jgi:hypothetical protein
MLLGEGVIVYLENHVKPTNTVGEENVELLIVKEGGTYSYHWALKCYLWCNKQTVLLICCPTL